MNSIFFFFQVSQFIETIFGIQMHLLEDFFVVFMDFTEKLGSLKKYEKRRKKKKRKKKKIKK